MDNLTVTYLEPSIPAYIILNNVLKLLNIKEAPEESVMNGNVEKIIVNCNKIIDESYHDINKKELLKYYVARSFFEDYNLEIDEEFKKHLIS